MSHNNHDKAITPLTLCTPSFLDSVQSVHATTIAMSVTNDDVQVRLVDQEAINEFGRLNNRLLEVRADVKQLKQDAEKLEDASTELMMAEGGRVMLLIGEAFVHVTEDNAGEYCEKKQAEITARIDKFSTEENDIIKRCEVLKKELYARFGDSINLEN